MSDISDVMDKWSGTTGLDEGGLATVRQLFDISSPGYRKTAADGMASTTTADDKFWTNPFDFSVQIVGAKLSCDSAVTANGSNYATVQVKKDDAIGGASVVAAAYSTDVSSIVANVPKDMVLTLANVVVAPGANVFFAITKTGTGVVVPISSVHLRLRKL